MPVTRIGACVGLGLALFGCTGGDGERPVARVAPVTPAAVVRAAPSTLPSVATTEPLPVSLAGVETRGVRVVYVCDFSGSMMDKFDHLRDRLNRSVAGLRPPQSYAATFFQDDGVLAGTNGLQSATAENKASFEAFLARAYPHGSSDPIPALRAAFVLEPDTIFFVTDGDFPNNVQVLNEIRKLNKDRRVKVHTLAYGDRGDEYEKLLREIADENGGIHRFVEAYAR